MARDPAYKNLAQKLSRATGGETLTDEEKEEMDKQLEALRKAQEDERRKERESIRKRAGF